MTEEKIKILIDLKKSLSKRFNEDLKDVVLFGSQLTEDNSKDSDYDILIIVKRKTNWELEREISDICYDIDLKYGILTDTHVLGESELNSPRGKQPIFINAISNGYHV
ncbi:MAG: nucleotidyltransferase domain-containing protein [Bacteroidetes bacterium HGW-Bacteroidetes-12]|nr:MAG: nucleotidyltransferase domain-containing protein [Bacteroidetes bacterium HGW-Bacteroidetes-12]